MTKIGAGLRWTGRIWSLASLAFVISFAVGSRETPTASEAVGLVFFPLAVVAGLITGWAREALGGTLTVLGLSGFYAWSFLTDGRLPRGPWFLLVAAPGFLFLMARAFEGSRPKPAG